MPTSGLHGCDGGSWQLLDKSAPDASTCESLCIQHAKVDGCCYLGPIGKVGCYYKPGGTHILQTSCNGQCLSADCSTTTCSELCLILYRQLKHSLYPNTIFELN